MKITKTNSELNEFNAHSSLFLESDEKDTKASSLVRKQMKRCVKALEDFNEKMEDARILNCSVDDNKNIIRDAKQNYVYKKEALQKLTNVARDLGKKEVELDLYLTKDIMSTIKDHYYKNYFLDFIGEEETPTIQITSMGPVATVTQELEAKC